jgi:hypothetical protein
MEKRFADAGRTKKEKRMREIKMAKMIKTSVKGMALSVVVFICGATAMAQCGGSIEAMMAAVASARTQSKVLKATPADTKSTVAVSDFASDRAVNPSIVGLWHIRFFVETPDGPLMIQEAFQIWNTGGTEVHNPNVDPRGGSVCLGAWEQTAPLTFNLTHRVWLYDTSGHFQAIGHLTESLTLGDRGTTHSGTFTLQAFDTNGNPLGEPAQGTVVGERISPN